MSSSQHWKETKEFATHIRKIFQDTKTIPGESHAPQSDIQDQDFPGNAAWLAGESRAEENTKYDGCDDVLLCKEILDSSAILNDPGLDSTNLEDIADYATQRARNDHESWGISILDSLELDTPDFDLSLDGKIIAPTGFVAWGSGTLQWLEF